LSLDAITQFSIFSQGQSARDYWLRRGLSALERYFFLILFNAYLHEQVRKKVDENEIWHEGIRPEALEDK